MENKLNILAVGRNEAIMQVVGRLLNAHDGWVGTVVLKDEEVVAAMGKASYHIVLLCSGITTEEENVLKEKVKAIDPTVVIAQHFGGGSGLLENEMLSILERPHIDL